MNELFDLGNGAYKKQWVLARKPRLKPYSSLDDPRFQEYEDKWRYFQDWQREVDSTPNLTQAERSSRILSKQTLNAWELICKAIPECIKFLLKEGTKYIMARVFCQDPLEQHFAQQRASQGRNQNPDEEQYLRNENSIHLQGKLKIKRRGANTEQSSNVFFDDSPLPRKKKATRRSLMADMDKANDKEVPESS